MTKDDFVHTWKDQNINRAIHDQFEDKVFLHAQDHVEEDTRADQGYECYACGCIHLREEMRTVCVAYNSGGAYGKEIMCNVCADKAEEEG